MDEGIPKINPEKPYFTKVENSSEINESGSVLIPQIKLKDTNIGRNPVRKRMNITKKKRKVIYFGLTVLLIFAGIFLIVGGLTYNVYRQGLKLVSSTDKLKVAAKSQDLELVKKELTNTKVEVNNFKTTFRSISWMKIVPYFGKFIDDGSHVLNATLEGLDAGEVVIAAVEPYADIIGFKSGSEQAASGDETTQDRIDFVVKTIPNLIPAADTLTKSVESIEKELSYIDPQDYPEKVKGKEVRSKLVSVLELFQSGSTMVKNSKPFLEAVPGLIGTQGERTYLILFQNDKELRPTGGFITAYSIATVKEGKFNPVLSSDIYNLDNKYKPSIAAPDVFPVLLKGIYITNNKFRLRDMNWNPDFEESMKTFLEESKKAGIGNIDGIIAVDTQLLVNLLDVIGPIGVPGYGNFSTQIVPECKCPQVIYELESFADQEGAIVWSENEPGKIVFAPPNYDNRKKIIGPLMNSILANTLGQPKEKLPKLAEAALKSVMEKHVLLYMVSESEQNAISDFGIGGSVVAFSGDYLYINDANLGGRKSNLYVTQEVEQDIKISRDGSVEKTLTLTYKNPEKHDGWLNSVLPNHVRIYVPKGSQLIKFDGAEKTEELYEELDKTVISGSFNLRPEGVAKLTVKYKLPFKVKDDYKLLIQKQPGKDKPRYSIKVGRVMEEFSLATDREFKFGI
ncbi:MAG: hypothetical protein US62_C0002G0016 [Candidatus Woesebacteria bacterium GW2011_GWA1_37_8]|uniref:DUF4012 domain-containing protein n=1 Tax=Candidatus Woesebacteria bacterium GW2011_GWA1_37_8 TaxID=1618546 RepID=A0A0G0HT59_9BACT|nr:MAG: hypothetical protein US39_C0009G0014 [Microgenomates group bacterium GW2011_GWC1_37_12b]KKQ46333.1 MAG: hypothetical protein US62_C0002G0016 [Candidatus Woesebacteria bacterium GW2011_GWA1_37_8]